MATIQKYRVPAATIETDREALVALRRLEGYQPVNPNHSVEALTALSAKVQEIEEAELHAQNALADIRNALIMATWEFHNALCGSKSQVIAQFGNDSQAVQAIGLTKLSDRKRPVRRASASIQS